jgi:hypothetical protein
MLTDDQLADQLRAQLRREVAGIQPSTDLLASVRRRQSRRSRSLRVSLLATPVTAAAAAVAVLVATSGGAEHARAAVLTAEMVHRLADASRLAMAESGRTTISYRETDNGTLQVTGTDKIAFAGKNWNDVVSQTFPAADGQPASTQTAINRIVDGQFYLYTEGKDNRVRWFRDTNPTGHPRVRIPDPRTLFSVLDPAARFVVKGHQVVGGLRLTELRATKPRQLSALGWLSGGYPGAHLRSLTVWVDRQHVVHRMSLQVKQTRTSYPMYFKKRQGGPIEIIVPSKAFLKQAMAEASKMRRHQQVIVRVVRGLPARVHHHTTVTWVSVAFTAIGVPQVIPAPRNAVPVYSRG